MKSPESQGLVTRGVTKMYQQYLFLSRGHHTTAHLSFLSLSQAAASSSPAAGTSHSLCRSVAASSYPCRKSSLPHLHALGGSPSRHCQDARDGMVNSVCKGTGATTRSPNAVMVGGGLPLFPSPHPFLRGLADGCLPLLR
jgi:hypothetical protein